MNKLKLLNKIIIPILCLISFTGCNKEAPNISDSTQIESVQAADISDTQTEQEPQEPQQSNSSETNTGTQSSVFNQSQPSFTSKDIPAFSGNSYVVINNNVPYFTDSDNTTKSFEHYSNLDSLGRCGVAFANIGQDIMPAQGEKRGSIGQIKPSGWHTIKYDNVDGKYLYNRCHLIGWQLSAENANEKNLITGTRYFNVEGMLPFENMVADYIRETNNHVLYRVTPVYEGNNLVASGVLMEAKSVEDNGKSVSFCTFVYNTQPGITINYTDGSSYSSGATTNSNSETKTTSKSNSESTASSNKQAQNEVAVDSNKSSTSVAYVLNTNSHKFHKPSCASAKKISSANREDFSGTRDEVISKGYDPCKNCNP